MRTQVQLRRQLVAHAHLEQLALVGITRLEAAVGLTRPELAQECSVYDVTETLDRAGHRSVFRLVQAVAGAEVPRAGAVRAAQGPGIDIGAARQRRAHEAPPNAKPLAA